MSTRFTIKTLFGDSSTQDFPGETPEKVYFDGLLPETNYYVTAELYYGDNVVDTSFKSFKTSIEYNTEELFLLNEAEEENVLTLTKTGTPETTDLQYSLDNGSNWTTFDLNQETNTVTIPATGRVYLRSSTGFSKNSSNFLNIKCSNNFSVHGNIQCLQNYKDLTNTIVDEYAFNYLFDEATTLISAKYLYMPARTVLYAGYRAMFRNCTSLTTSPELPATGLTYQCYEYMFQGCSKLSVGPSVLPATNIRNYCYQYMFDGCNSLRNAPELPATTLADSCYRYMFRNCHSLRTAPLLPAPYTASRCYQYMFVNCIYLTSVTIYCEEWSMENAENWLSGAGTDATDPTVYHLSGIGIPVNSYSGVPRGWGNTIIENS